MVDTNTRAVISSWQLPQDGALLERVERMIEPAILSGHFGSSPTQMVCGLQYHLGGAEDTRQLAELAGIQEDDHILDVCCFLGGPALQLAETYGCRVTGIDISETAILGAQRIAELTGLDDHLTFKVADAAQMPFEDALFSVVWNQGSLNHDEAWLREFDRVLRPGGRLALVFEIRPENAPKDAADRRWALQQMVTRIEAMGYQIDHAADLTEREISLGWEALGRRLEARRDLYAAAMGEAWIQEAAQEFRDEIVAMRQGKWSNGRLIATKRIA